MIGNYLKIALRAVSRQKVLATINIASLSIGLGCFILFSLYAINELSYDRSQPNAARIYRVNEWWDGIKGREPNGEAAVYIPLAPALKQDFPDVEEAVRFADDFGSPGGGPFMRANDKIFQSKLSFADPRFFSVFHFNFLYGNPSTALDDAHNIILTRSKALQLFGDINVVGKTLEIRLGDNFVSFRVSAVTEDPPANSTIRYMVLGSLKYHENTPEWKEAMTNWHEEMGFIPTYVLLKEGSHLATDRQRLSAFRHKYYPNEEAELKKDGLWDGKGPLPVSFRLEGLRDLHTDTKVDAGNPDMQTNPRNVWTLLAIAVAILLIASINFTTLAIGRSAGRAKEVGVRKVIGSSRSQLILQFLTESLLLTGLSALIGCLLAQAFLPFFERFTGRELHFSFREFPEMAWLLIGSVLLVGILAGCYPALVLSGFRPVEVLKKKIRLGGSNLFTRSLVGLQFVVSIALILATIVILRQLNLLYTKDLGFDKENVVMLHTEGTDTKDFYPLLRQSLLAHPGIMGVAASGMALGEDAGMMGDLFTFHDKQVGMIEYTVDTNYLKVLGMRLIAGRNFSSLAQDTVSSVIVNEAFLKTTGLQPDSAIGAELKPGRPGGGSGPSKRIIGVIKDFNYSSLAQEVRPQLFFQPSTPDRSEIFIRLRPGDPSAALAQIMADVKRLQPTFPLRYTFLDENINRFYKSEAKWSTIFEWAGGISIFLACLGLFGLAALSAANRTLEIGIRKILGADLPSIVYVLSGDFLKIVCIAFLVASPLAWYFLHKWLEAYPYRVQIGWGIFAFTGLGVILISLLTVGSQAIRTGMANPVKSLRIE